VLGAFISPTSLAALDLYVSSPPQPSLPPPIATLLCTHLRPLAGTITVIVGVGLATTCCTRAVVLAGQFVHLGNKKRVQILRKRLSACVAARMAA